MSGTQSAASNPKISIPVPVLILSTTEALPEVRRTQACNFD
jgi:hypothetical protein